MNISRPFITRPIATSLVMVAATSVSDAVSSVPSISNERASCSAVVSAGRSSVLTSRIEIAMYALPWLNVRRYVFADVSSQPSGGVYEVSLPLLIGVAATLAGLMALVVVKIVQVRESPVAVGPSTFAGTSGVVRNAGLVFVNGELWRARTEDGAPLRQGDEVEVERMDGLELVVRPRGA